MIRKHKAAYLARLREDADLASRVFEGDVPPLNGEPRNRYVNVYVNSGVRRVERFMGSQSEATFTYTVHSVSVSADAAQELSDRVMAQTLDHVLIVEGRVCRRLIHTNSQPTAIDRDISPPLWYAVDQFDVTSSPA